MSDKIETIRPGVVQGLGTDVMAINAGELICLVLPNSANLELLRHRASATTVTGIHIDSSHWGLPWIRSRYVQTNGRLTQDPDCGISATRLFEYLETYHLGEICDPFAWDKDRLVLSYTGDEGEVIKRIVSMSFATQNARALDEMNRQTNREQRWGDKWSDKSAWTSKVYINHKYEPPALSTYEITANSGTGGMRYIT